MGPDVDGRALGRFVGSVEGCLVSVCEGKVLGWTVGDADG